MFEIRFEIFYFFNHLICVNSIDSVCYSHLPVRCYVVLDKTAWERRPRVFESLNRLLPCDDVPSHVRNHARAYRTWREVRSLTKLIPSRIFFIWLITIDHLPVFSSKFDWIITKPINFKILLSLSGTDCLMWH